MSDQRPPCTPVILSGGAGTRLWPLSRELSPKQFVPLFSGRSLFQMTALRAAAATDEPPVVVCNIDHRGFVEEQLAEIDLLPAAVICEPLARNTAAAVASAALLLEDDRPGSLMLVMPSDHLVADDEQFAADVGDAIPAAAAGHLVTFGITPKVPETGYGYIRQGEVIDHCGRVHQTAEFVEKPELERAKELLRQGGWMWNSGVFLLPAAGLLEELTSYEPQVVTSVAASLAAAHRASGTHLLDRECFETGPSISLDYAVMERTDRAAVLPTTLDWSDVGAWSSLWEVSQHDEWGNVAVGDVLLEESSDCYVRSDGPLVAAIGMHDVTVVATEDAVLVADRTHSQQVREMVHRLRDLGRPEADATKLVRRPWGTYRSVAVGPRHQVKHITVTPGHKLSLQRHRHRSEHWVVVEGVAKVVHGETSRELEVNESLFVPQGCVHRLENPGPGPLHLVEVQVGDYLGEDDIERLADDYGRLGDPTNPPAGAGRPPSAGVGWG